jgi:hypothetical protein
VAKLVHPPVPIMAVLDAALQALNDDGRFLRVPNGHIEVSWRQPTKGRNGEGDRPARYAVTIECGFAPERAALGVVGEHRNE